MDHDDEQEQARAMARFVLEIELINLGWIPGTAVEPAVLVEAHLAVEQQEK